MFFIFNILLIVILYFESFNSGNLLVAKYSENINASQNDIVDWFYELDKYPERYSFDTHEGIYLENNQSSFAINGSRFYTIEKFYFLRLKLNFRMENITDHGFNIILEKSLFPVIGIFNINENCNVTELEILIKTYNNSYFGKLLHLSFIKNIVYNQIKKEIINIKIYF